MKNERIVFWSRFVFGVCVISMLWSDVRKESVGRRSGYGVYGKGVGICVDLRFLGMVCW